jgi:hypothetical protein
LDPFGEARKTVIRAGHDLARTDNLAAKEAIADAFAELERAQQAVIMAKGALHKAKDAVLGAGHALTDAERTLEMRKSLRRAYEAVAGAMGAVSRIDSA